jgi:hypothetical protein
MPSIIISYRRSDSDVIAGRIRDRLANHYGNDSIYMDIDSIPFGLDFRDHIKAALLKNDILIAIIGPNWLGQSGTNARIYDETDPVRMEVEAAFQRGIPVIPVLVAGATIPNPADLPDSLKDLAFRNAATVSGGRDFHQHMDRLVRSINALLPAGSKAPSISPHKMGNETAANRRRGSYVIAIAVVLCLTVAVVAGWSLLSFVQSRSSAPPVPDATNVMPRASSIEDISGSYEGTNTFESRGLKSDAQISLVIQLSGDKVTVTYKTATGATGSGTGAISTATMMTKIMLESHPSCPGSFATQFLFSPDAVSWVYTGQDCSGPQQGHGRAKKTGS